jgi:transcriptional regulator with XRE-family HTH domain
VDNRADIREFLATRRAKVTPEQAGLPAGGGRRRVPGLRREEVAVLAGMSADYYSRLEQQRGPMPSEQMVAALARGLKLSPGEREHLFAVAGHSAPRRAQRDEQVSPAMRRIVERLTDTPAIVFSRFGEALLQTRSAVALFGDYTRFAGMSRYLVYRWFTDPAQRALYPAEDHAVRGRVFTVDIRAAYTADLLVLLAEPGSPSDEKLQRLINLDGGGDGD